MDKTFKPSAYSPFEKQPAAPQKLVKKYSKPDPSKKQNCAEDRPIKLNPTGQYNLNFIDWENEFDAVMDADENIMNGDDPLYGMDVETFDAIVVSIFYEFTSILIFPIIIYYIYIE